MRKQTRTYCAKTARQQHLLRDMLKVNHKFLCHLTELSSLVWRDNDDNDDDDVRSNTQYFAQNPHKNNLLSNLSIFGCGHERARVSIPVEFLFIVSVCFGSILCVWALMMISIDLTQIYIIVNTLPNPIAQPVIRLNEFTFGLALAFGV